MQDDQGTFVQQFLELLDSATEIVNPLNLYRALIREHLNALDFEDTMSQYQAVELFLDAFVQSPETGPGCPYFNFMQPSIVEWSVMSGCQACGTEDHATRRIESKIPYFTMQIQNIPQRGTLAASFGERFHG